MKTLFVHPSITKFLESLEELKQLDCSARSEYSHHHRRLVDIQHEIELSEDAYEPELKVAVFDHLQEVANERRKAKDTILVLDILKKTLHNGTQLEALGEVLTMADEEWKRNYFPRQIKSLDFTNKDSLKLSRLEMTTRPDSNSADGQLTEKN